MTHSTIEFLRPIPSVALIPLAVLLFGSQIQSTLVLVVYASFWPVLIQVLYGVQDVDPVARETARSYGLGTWAQIRYVTWPTTLPYLMTGIRLAAAVALILAITSEVAIDTQGLGKEITDTESGGAVAVMYAYVIVAGIIGVIVNLGARALERRVLAWHPSMRLDSAEAARMKKSAVPPLPRRVAVALALPVTLIATWWITSADSQSFYFPPLQTILQTFGKLWFSPQAMSERRAQSCGGFSVGYLAAAFLGIAIGIPVGASRNLRNVLEPVLEFLRAIPPPVLVPVLILFAGLGNEMKALVILFGCIWPVLLNTVAGVRALDEVLAEDVRSYRIGGSRGCGISCCPARVRRFSPGCGNRCRSASFSWSSAKCSPPETASVSCWCNISAASRSRKCGAASFCSASSASCCR